MKRIAFLVALCLGIASAPADAQVYWSGSNTTQSLPMQFEMRDGTIDGLTFASSLYCPKTRTTLTVAFTLSGFPVAVEGDGSFVIEHLADQFFLRVTGTVSEAGAFASGAADFNWAGIFQKARGPLNPRKMAIEKCFAQGVRWEAVMAIPAGPLESQGAAGSAGMAAAYRVRLDNGPSGIEVTTSTGP
jgi:hypothetical protein